MKNGPDASISAGATSRGHPGRLCWFVAGLKSAIDSSRVCHSFPNSRRCGGTKPLLSSKAVNASTCRLRCLSYALIAYRQAGLPLDPVDQVSTLWITLPPSGPTKRALGTGLAVSAVAPFGCQKDSCFCSWTLWTTTLILRIRQRPSGSAPIEQQGQRVGSECFPFLSTILSISFHGGSGEMGRTKSEGLAHIRKNREYSRTVCISLTST